MADIPWEWVLASAVVAVALVVILIVVVLPPSGGCMERYALGVNEADGVGITSTTQTSGYQNRYGTQNFGAVGFSLNKSPASYP